MIDRPLARFVTLPEGHDVRGQPMSFKVTRTERRAIEEAAAREGKSVAGFLRDRALRGLTP